MKLNFMFFYMEMRLFNTAEEFQAYFQIPENIFKEICELTSEYLEKAKTDYSLYRSLKFVMSKYIKEYNMRYIESKFTNLQFERLCQEPNEYFKCFSTFNMPVSNTYQHYFSMLSEYPIPIIDQEISNIKRLIKFL